MASELDLLGDLAERREALGAWLGTMLSTAELALQPQLHAFLETPDAILVQLGLRDPTTPTPFPRENSPAVRGDEQRIRKGVERIVKATDVMHQLLDELLELSRIGRFDWNPAEVELSDLAHEGRALVSKEIAERGARVSIEELPMVVGDRRRLVEVFQNLSTNALRFRRQDVAPEVVVGIRRDGPVDVVFVRDNGVGIEPRYHSKVFDLFERLDQDRPGTGIGLAIVKRVVELHQGKVWVESEGANCGSTFCFTVGEVPMSDARLPETARRAADVET